MDKRKSILLGAAGAALSAAAICEGLTMAIDWGMVCEALDRCEPKMPDYLKLRIKGYADAMETVKYLEIGAARLETMPHRQVRIFAQDGTELRGHLFGVENPERVILAMHGWRSGWARDFCMAADFFHDSGCTVLYAEQRGQGKSGGEYMGFGMIERYDCLEWVKWLSRNGFEQLPIYLAGISMGATTVLMTAGFAELPGNVAGILADCGFTSARAEWQYISQKNLHIPYRKRHVDSLCRRRIALNADSYSTIDAMRMCRTPVLFVHGSADTFVPVEMTLENYAACSAPKRMLIVEGANHGMSYVVSPKRYQGVVREFWQACEAH